MESEGLVEVDAAGHHHVTGTYHFRGLGTFTADGEGVGHVVQEALYQTSGHFAGESHNVEVGFGLIHLGQEAGNIFVQAVQIAQVAGALATQRDTAGGHVHNVKLEVTAAGLIQVRTGGGIIVQDGVIGVEGQHGTVVGRKLVAGGDRRLGVLLTISRYLLFCELQTHVAGGVAGTRIIREGPTVLVGGVGQDGTDILQIIGQTLRGRDLEYVGLVLQAGSKRQQCGCGKQNGNGFFQFHILFLPA